MIDPDIALALENPEWLQVLRGYHQQAQQEPEAPGNVSLLQVAAESQSSQSPADAAGAEDSEETSGDGESEGSPKQRRGARWLTRIHHFEGLAREDLSKIHGRLIAYGFLKCDLAERTAEVVYQVTLAGKQLLNLSAPNTSEATDADPIATDSDSHAEPVAFPAAA